MQDKILQLLSLSQRAGFVKSGEFMTENTIKDGMAKLVIVAEDASDNTKKHFSDMCSYRNVPIIYYGLKEDIGHYIGKQFRASVCVTDEGLAKKILSETKN